MAGVTSNRPGVRLVIILLVLLFLGFAYCEAQAGPFISLHHASTGGSTDVNTGRNFIMGGYETRSGLGVGFGRYFIGSSSCANSMVLHQKIDNGRWMASLHTYGTRQCSKGNRSYPKKNGNIGACVNRIARLDRFGLGFGACLWQHADVAVHNLPAGRFDNDEMQFTASILLQYGGR